MARNQYEEKVVEFEDGIKFTLIWNGNELYIQPEWTVGAKLVSLNGHDNSYTAANITIEFC